MIRVKDIYSFLNSIAPFAAQESWDNSGLLVGDASKHVRRAALALDLNFQTLEEAKKVGADLIVTHHPVIFKAQKSFLSGSLPYELAKNDISVISAHTCFDCAEGGVNDVLCSMLGMSDVKAAEEADNMLRIGKVPKMSADEFSAYVGKKLGANVRRSLGNNEIETVAVCSGSGASFLSLARELGADALVTGDASHHDFVDACADSILLVAAGHFETENPAMASLAGKLRAEFKETEFILIEEENPIKYIGYRE